MNKITILSILLSLVIGLNLKAQQKEAIIPFSNEAGVKSLEIDIFNARINIIGTNRKDILMKYESVRSEEHDPHKKAIPEKAKGMKKIASNNLNFEIKEKNNHVLISSENFHNIMYLTLEVPKEINLEIQKEIGEDIVIDNLSGTLNLESNVGSIIVKSFEGSISASASTGNIEIEFKNIPANETMIFNSITGNIDLLLPTSVKADLKLRTEWGDIFSDHDVVTKAQQPELKKTTKGETMKMISQEWTIGTINGGGDVNITCNTKMGSILLRK